MSEKRKRCDHVVLQWAVSTICEPPERMTFWQLRKTFVAICEFIQRFENSRRLIRLTSVWLFGFHFVHIFTFSSDRPVISHRTNKKIWKKSWKKIKWNLKSLLGFFFCIFLFIYFFRFCVQQLLKRECASSTSAITKCLNRFMFHLFRIGAENCGLLSPFFCHS